ncbi:MAG: imidazolonepropionase-like amidohydrolase [Planctomycetota bacterium]|jgi:imidazolonepropionase-like amidohydrolase
MKRSLITFLFLVCAFVPLHAQRRADNRAVLFQVGKVYVGNDTVLSPGMVLVKNGKIAAVGKTLEVPKGTMKVNRPNWTLTPGMIDAAAEGFGNSTEGISEVIPGFKVSDGLDLSQKQMKTLAKEGVTTVFVTASTDSVIGCQGAIAKTGEKARVLSHEGDPKLTVSKGAVNGNRGPSQFSGISVYTRRPTSQMGIIFVARDAFTKAQEYAKAKQSKNKPDKDLHYDVLADVLAKKRPIRVRGEEQYELTAALKMVVEFGFTPIFENAIEAWRIAKDMKRHGASLVFGPAMPQPAPTGRFGRRGAPAKTHPRAAKMLVDEGVQMALTAGSNTGEKGLARQAGYTMRYGLTRIQAVKAVTSIPAAMLGMEKKIGLIKVGLDADFVLWTGEPFASTSRPEIVFIDGVAVKGKTF